MLPLPAGYKVIDEYRTDITSPAYTNPARRELHINHPVFDSLAPRHQDFIVLHELGHRYTVSEFEADRLAFYEFVKRYNSPKAAVNALYYALSGIIPEHEQRYFALLRIAAEYDLKHNGNKKAQKVLDAINNFNKDTNMDRITKDEIATSLINAGYNPEEVYQALDEANSFEGLDENMYASGKAAERKAAKQAKKDQKAAAKQAKKEQKAANKQAKQDAKIAKKNAKAEVVASRAAKNQAKAEAISNGTYQSAGSKILDTVTGIGSKLANKYLGTGDEEVYDESDYVDYGSTESKSGSSTNWGLWLGIGGGVLAIIIIVVIIILKKKK